MKIWLWGNLVVLSNMHKSPLLLPPFSHHQACLDLNPMYPMAPLTSLLLSTAEVPDDAKLRVPVPTISGTVTSQVPGDPLNNESSGDSPGLIPSVRRYMRSKRRVSCHN